jgi:hypothetical protein
MSSLASALLALAVLGAFALAGGGVWFIARQGDTTKGVLMIVAALVVLGNVLILTV